MKILSVVTNYIADLNRSGQLRKISAHLLSGLFLLSALAKLVYWSDTIKIMNKILPGDDFGIMIAILVVFLELLLTLMLLLPHAWRYAGITSFYMLIMFTLVAGAAKYAGLITSCPCFGNFFGGDINYGFYLRNLFLGGLSIIWAGGIKQIKLSNIFARSSVVPTKMRLQHGTSFIFILCIVLLMLGAKIYSDKHPKSNSYKNVNEKWNINTILESQEYSYYPAKPDIQPDDLLIIYTLNSGSCSLCTNEIFSYIKIINKTTFFERNVKQIIILLDNSAKRAYRSARILNVGIPAICGKKNEANISLIKWAKKIDERQLIVYDNKLKKILSRVHLIKSGQTPDTRKNTIISMLKEQLLRNNRK